MKEKIWTRGDVLAGLFTGLVAFAAYAWTAAPNVTLLDSGEFITAAEHFGVPHPTGYPLWTLLAWIFLLLPLGNAAWQAAIFSGFCAALAVGLSTALSRSSLRWLMGDFLERWRGLATIVPVTCGLLLTFSFSMWSQATTVKDYTLHTLIICLSLSALYAWLRRPDCLRLLLLTFFLLALAFSTHHLTLGMVPLPFLAVLLVRRGMFLDLLIAGCLTALLAYLGFAILSADPLVLKTAIRFFYCVMLGLVVLVAARRFQIEWRLVAYLPFVVALGMLPYAYMPFASSTNPPMNWSYTRTPEGFFYAFNRSQYSGTLSQQSLRSLGKLMGSAGEQPDAATKPPEPGEKSLYAELQEWAGFFWLQLGRSFTPIGVLGYFGALFVIFRLADVPRRTWVYVAELGFVFAAGSFVGSAVTSGSPIDNAGWWVQMPCHTHTNMFFALLAALGIAFGCGALFSKFPRLAWMRFLLLLLPVMPLLLNEAGCSQRGHWFGWQFGHDMLKDLPRGSVVLGGTDPGRFVPTYMILGESTQPPGVKRDPEFDRRDLYIITQNGVGEKLYRKYLADQYSPNRQVPKNAFERWLGRAEAYPKESLNFPTDEEIRTAIEKELEAARGTPDPALAHSVVTRLIWEKNKDSHDFFVEESFPLTWSYNHALPHGLVYQIAKEPLKEIPADVVKKDMEFWNAYVGSLLQNPNFSDDYDAQRSFSKLRTTTGHIYQHRKLLQEAETAYRQSLVLWPGNPESLSALNSMLWERGDYEGVIKILEPANAADPNNFPLWQMRVFAEKRKELEGDIRGLTDSLAKNPKDRDKTGKLLAIYTSTGETNKTTELLNRSVELFGDDAGVLRQAVQYGEMNNLSAQEVAAAKKLVAAGTNSGDDYLLLARAFFRNNDKTNFYLAARTAIEKGGIPMREAIFGHPLFAPWRQEEDFKSLHNPLPTKK